MALAYVGLGGNLGETRATLTAALHALADLAEPGSLRCSRWYRSAPLDASGPDFLNAVACFDATLPPHELLAALQRIELAQGRERPYRNAPRTLDLDLLLYGDQSLDTDSLTLPHPRLHERAFVLRPLADLAPGIVVPGRGALQDLLPGVADQRLEALSG